MVAGKQVGAKKEGKRNELYVYNLHLPALAGLRIKNFCSIPIRFFFTGFDALFATFYGKQYYTEKYIKQMRALK